MDESSTYLVASTTLNAFDTVICSIYKLKSSTAIFYTFKQLVDKNLPETLVTIYS
jgi:hypothetical protein